MTAAEDSERQNDRVSVLPSVAVVMPNWNGAAHLPHCLDSLEAVDYPRDRVEVLVVDNGSTDGSRELLRRRYPSIRVVELAENDGFAGACNAGAEAVSADCIAFLNNDMRVDAGWLRALVDAYEPAPGYVWVAGVIQSWDGSGPDFPGAWATFPRHPGQDHF